MQVELLVAGIGTVGTLIGVWLGSRGSIKAALAAAEIEKDKHARDQVWDAKKQAYAVITGQLAALARLSERHSEGFDPDPEAYFHSHLYDNRNDELVGMYQKLIAEIEGAALIASNDFSIRAEQLQSDIERIDDEADIPPEKASAIAAAFRRAAADLLAIARNEIAPPV
jgi:hypothetical protein